MAARPDALTSDHFSQYWKYVSRKRRWSKKKAVIRSISVPLSQILYFFVFVIFSYGAAYSMIPGMVHRYIMEIPELAALWADFEAVYFASAATETQRLIRTAAALYLLPFSASILPTLLICLLYHPRSPKKVGDPVQDAGELWIMAKHAEVYAQRKEPNIVNTCAAFAGMLIVVAALGYLLYGLFLPATKQQVIAQAHTANVRLAFYALVLFFSYKIVNLPLHFMLKLLHFCHVPKDLVSVTEEYYHAAQHSSEETAAGDP